MKKFLIPLAIVVVLLAASPYLVGLRARGVVEGMAAKLTEVGYTATMDSYEVGYLRSQGKLTIGIDPRRFMSADMTPEERATAEEMLAFLSDGVTVDLDIKHGPLLQTAERSTGLFVADIALSGDSEVLAVLEQELGVDVLMTTRVSFGFTGDGEVVVNGQPFMIATDDGSNVDFGGFDYRVDMQNWGRRFDASGEIHEITGTGFDSTFRFAPMVVAANGEFIDDTTLWFGEASFTTEGMFFSGAEGGTVEGISMQMATTSSSPETLDASYRFNVDRITGGTLLYDIQDIVVNASMVKANVAAVQELQAIMADPERAANTAAILVALERMFNGAELRLDEVSFRYGPDVDLMLSGATSIREGVITSLANAATTPPNPVQMMGLVNLRLSLDVSQGMIDQVIDLVLRNQVAQMAPEATPEQIDQLIELQKLQMTTMIPGLVQGGMLRESTRGYQADLLLENGTVTINGNPVPIPGL